jgi:hypothetical protein
MRVAWLFMSLVVVNQAASSSLSSSHSKSEPLSSSSPNPPPLRVVATFTRFACFFAALQEDH